MIARLQTRYVKGPIDMKTRLILAGMAALLTAPLAAQAADFPQPYRAPAPAYLVPEFSWSGFYVGLNAGYMWGNSKWNGSAGNFEVAPSGFIGGGTLGYNLQTGSWVWGIEGDVDYLDANRTIATAVCGSCTFKDTWLATARGRIGYSFDRWLPYVTGGGAWGDVYMSSPSGSNSSTKGGWTAGAGVEYAFLGNWSAKLEYLYVDLGSANCGSSACPFAADTSVDFTANIIRAGINYRF